MSIETELKCYVHLLGMSENIIVQNFHALTFQGKYVFTKSGRITLDYFDKHIEYNILMDFNINNEIIRFHEF